MTQTSDARRPTRRYAYVADGPAIYADSFATIRREADLSHIPAEAEKLAVRMIHGTGQPDLVHDLVIHPTLVSSARTALRAGAPILCDARMVATGITAGRLPAANQVHCYLNEDGVPALAISSTDCRRRAAEGRPLWYLMPDGVVQYVSKRRLYRTPERSESPAAPSLAAGNST